MLVIIDIDHPVITFRYEEKRFLKVYETSSTFTIWAVSLPTDIISRLIWLESEPFHVPYTDSARLGMIAIDDASTFATLPTYIVLPVHFVPDTFVPGGIKTVYRLYVRGAFLDC